MTSKDTIFADRPFEKGSFEFNDEVANVFDDMLNRSIPFYRESIDILCNVVKNFHSPQKIIYDLGCSTGNTLLKIHEDLKNSSKKDLQNIEYIGIDDSQAMIEKFNQKILTAKTKKMKAICDDINTADLSNSGTIILNYILQFLSISEREKLVQKISNSLIKKGIVFVSEKIIDEDDEFNDFLTEQYFDFKEKNGYSQIEISRKRQALENVLIPLSLEKNLALFHEAGFEKVSVLLKWHNFVSFVAIKS